MPYLEDLTIRLATGMAQLPDDVRSRHAAFVVGTQRPDGGWAGREGSSDLYYTGFALRSLALTGELHGRVAECACEFLAARLNTQVGIVDFLSLIYGAALVENAAGLDVFAAANAQWRDRVAAELERFRRPDGGYAKADEGHSSSTYHTFLMLLGLELIGRSAPEPQRIVDFFRSRQREDGGFVELAPMRRSGTNPTAAAIGGLSIFHAVDDQMRCHVTDFLTDMQTDEGGLRANTRIPIADLLSTFTGLLTLADLEAMGEVDQPAVSRYVEQLALPGGGFHGAAWDEATDVEYTFYGLGVLAILNG